MKPNKAQQIKATSNLRGNTVRIEVSLAGSLDVLWLNREEAANFISELKVAYEEIVGNTETDSRPVEDGNL
jgi:hypothetical protein